jgi:hypothetical protein
MAKVRDIKSADNFLSYLINDNTVGVSDGEEFSVPKAPEAKAFLSALLGEHMPSYAWNICRHNNSQALRTRNELAEFFYSLGDFLSTEKKDAP